MGAALVKEPVGDPAIAGSRIRLEVLSQWLQTGVGEGAAAALAGSGMHDQQGLVDTRLCGKAAYVFDCVRGDHVGVGDFHHEPPAAGASRETSSSTSIIRPGFMQRVEPQHHRIVRCRRSRHLGRIDAGRPRLGEVVVVGLDVHSWRSDHGDEMPMRHEGLSNRAGGAASRLGIHDARIGRYPVTARSARRVSHRAMRST